MISNSGMSLVVQRLACSRGSLASRGPQLLAPIAAAQQCRMYSLSSARGNNTIYRDTKSYRPIYVAGRANLSRFQQNPARNLTNISSGSFAPTTPNQRITDHDVAQDDVLHTQPINVYQGSDHLPSLPVPQLGKTLELLKETIWPIAMNSVEFANALHLIESFSGSAGQKLDLLLRAKASQTKNWLTHDWWLQEAYLKSRVPLVINSNPSMIYPQLPFDVNSTEKLVDVTATLISGIVDYKLAILNGYNPETLGTSREKRLDNDICYAQYGRIFGYTRMPNESIDSLVVPENAREDQRFNLVCAHRGYFYEVMLEGIQNENHRHRALKDVLTKIISDDIHQIGVDGLGILTTSRRDVWANSVRLISEDALRAIKGADLMISIDRIPSQPQDSFVKPLLEQPNGSRSYFGALSRQVLHGDRTNVGNRWFDKSIQLVVVADETASKLLGAGINYEHSIGEAMVVTKMIEHSFNKTVMAMKSLSEIHDDHPSSECGAYSLKSLDMAKDSDHLELTTSVTRATQDFISQIDQFDLAYFDYDQYGRDTIKSWGFSPDSWFQIALQLSHYELHKRLGPCYESASTRRFAYGRTETIRSLTKDVAQFCLDPNYNSLQAAIQSHKTYALAANNASAVDRVLLGYRMIFNELKANQWSWGVPTFDSGSSPFREQSDNSRSISPTIKFETLANAQRVQQVDINDLFTEKELNILGAFFNNELFERSKKFALSTSQVSSLSHPRICMSYGPMVADGYGCCYNLSNERMVAAITANSSNQSFSCEIDRFSERLGESLDKMRDIVDSQQSHRQHDQQHEQRS